MVGQQSLFDFPGARLELVQPLSLVRSFSSEEALDLEFTEKTLHNLNLTGILGKIRRNLLEKQPKLPLTQPKNP
jgi:hypothetical protein